MGPASERASVRFEDLFNIFLFTCIFYCAVIPSSLFQSLLLHFFLCIVYIDSHIDCVQPVLLTNHFYQERSCKVIATILGM